MKIPSQATPSKELFETLESYREGDLSCYDGKTWGYVYQAGAEIDAIAKRAYTLFLSENALDPTVYPSLLRFENDIIGMCCDHLNAPEEAVGAFTSGGTESILLAVKAARDFARASRPELGQGEIIVPTTAHAAFHKAAHYFDLKVVTVPVDENSFAADPAAVRSALSKDTVLIIGSATSYAHGVMDPIEELGAIAADAGIPFHVDACIGGFLLPYFARLGDDVPLFDFRIPGVTSISMDLHKYAYCPKGASVLLHRSQELRRFQYFACATWTGYSVINPTVQSSKSGGPLAAAWAVLHAIGDEGYLKIAAELRNATRAIVAGIEAIDGLRVLGNPALSLIAFSSDEIDLFHVADQLKTRGWYVQPQLAYENSPVSLHLTIAPQNLPQVEALIADLGTAVVEARGMGKTELPPMLAAGLESMDLSSLDPAMLPQILAMAGIEGTELPERMALVNTLLNALPCAARELILTDFLGSMFRPTPNQVTVGAPS